jgi:hypothetical protein
MVNPLFTEGEELGKKVFNARKETCHSAPNLCALMLSQEICMHEKENPKQGGCISAVRKEYKKVDNPKKSKK